MANHFRQTAESLRNIAENLRAPTDVERASLKHAADILCRLERLKHDLISMTAAGDADTDNLAAELISLLGINRGS